MYIAYYDEAGDDGFPRYSSPLFVLSALYLHYLNWKRAFDTIQMFRRQLKNDFNIPIKWEIHTRSLLLNKNPYREIGLSNNDRICVIDLFCDLASQLDIKVVNIAINKTIIRKQDYRVLDRALTYSVQRIENDLKRIDPTGRFLIITDDGRVGKMRNTTRRIQKINFIPSRYGPEGYRQEIESLIEDPLPKNSKESYFIQLADTISYIVYLYVAHICNISHSNNRMPEEINKEKVIEWMQKLKGCLNVAASGENEYGVVCYPK